MNSRILILRSLRHYWRTHLGVVLGAAVATAVLVGALLVGDSVRYSLRHFALARLGDVQAAIDSGDRFFREALLVPSGAGGQTAPALRLRGIAANSEGTARANNVQVLGVDTRFWTVGGFRAPAAEIGDDEVVLNDRLAGQLGVGKGGQVLLRVDKPTALSRDAPLVPTDDASVAMRLTVAAVATDAQFGRFSLRTNQIAPYNAFVPLTQLQKKLGLEGRANLFLVCLLPPSHGGSPSGDLRRVWQLTDIGVRQRSVRDGSAVELCSDRVFLDPPLAAAALKAFPGAVGVLAYFANELRVGDHRTPYSMVAAIGGLDGSKAVPPLIPKDIDDDEVLINFWLAEDLQASPGDELEMTYFVIGPTRKLVEQKSRFRVRAVVPIEGLAADRTLMPNFPGLADVDNCRDWKPGIPIDLKKIRKKDEDYWARHRGAPKAFITLAAGQRIWGNRFGDLTAIRFPHPADRSRLEVAVLGKLHPADFGLALRPVREEALKASSQALDFGPLFLGLSFFLIAAAVLLTALLFVFGIEQRAEQMGTLLAVGFTPRRVRRLMLAEGGLLAVLGGAAGAYAGTLYTRVTLHALATVWRGAVARSAILYHAEPLTLVLGGVAGVVVALAAMWLTVRKQARKSPRELLAGAGGADLLEPRIARGRVGLWIAVGSIGAACVIVALLGARRDQAAAGGLFGAGALLLIGGLTLSHRLLSAAARPTQEPHMSLGGMGWRNSTRRRGRSLAVVALLACASFLVIAIGANRQDPTAHALSRSSGTGGFAFYGESAMPVYEDLNAEAGRKAYGLDAETMKGVSFVQVRVREGDDASCLNLNRAQAPRLLGVRPEALQSRKAFSFLKTARAADKPWLLLNDDLGEGVVPAIGDDPTLTWGLKKSIGDTLDYTDGRGRPFKVKIVGVIGGSVLQGNLLIAEDAFIKRFPSEPGYRAFLIDASAERRDEVSKELSRAMQDVGLELTPAARRLADFSAVENTYLAIFQALGGLALLLGSVGLGVVVLRNVLERRGELALLRAVGFSKRSLRWLVLSEHWGLLVLGLATGTISALIAVLPALRSPGAGVPVVPLAVTLLAVVVSGFLWTWLAALLALRGPLLAALREE